MAASPLSSPLLPSIGIHSPIILAIVALPIFLPEDNSFCLAMSSATLGSDVNSTFLILATLLYDNGEPVLPSSCTVIAHIFLLIYAGMSSLRPTFLPFGKSKFILPSDLSPTATLISSSFAGSINSVIGSIGLFSSTMSLYSSSPILP